MGIDFDVGKVVEAADGVIVVDVCSISLVGFNVAANK